MKESVMGKAALENLGNGIYCLDANYISPKFACCYLLVEGDEVAIVETGAAQTPASITQALEELNLPPNAVRYIIPTHVHLDHAGSAGVLMQQYPQAQLIIHPRGAKHMINPTRLIAGAKAVYGEEKFQQLYGELIPVPEQRVRVMEDGETLQLGSRTLEFRHTPGHAEHHFSIWDKVSQGWFSGDTFGLSYGCMGNGSTGRFIIPSSSPVQFSPDKLIASINMLMSYHPKRFYLTHYSVVEQPQQQAALLLAQINAYRSLAHSSENIPVTDREAHLLQGIKKITQAHMADIQPQIKLDDIEPTLAMDLALNAQGLNIWLERKQQE